MSIDETKCCNRHTKEKEKSGECCQLNNQKNAEQQTYEQSPMDMSLHELAKANPAKTYKELEKIKSGVCIIGAIKNDRR